MIVIVPRSRHRRPICCTFSPNAWRENGLPIEKMPFTNCAEWTGKQAASRWRQLFALWWAQNFNWEAHAGKFVLSFFPRTWEGNPWRPNWCRDVWATFFIFGSLDRESCSHHTFRHSFLREWFHFHSSHYIIASSCASYWSVIVVCIWIEHSSWTVVGRTCWGDQHSQDLKHVLQSCFHVKDVGSMWWGKACSAQDTRTEEDRQRRYVEQDQYLRVQHGPTQFQSVTNTTGKVCVVLLEFDTLAWLKQTVRLNRRFADGRQYPNWELDNVSVHIVGIIFHQFAWMWVHPEHGRPNSTSEMRRKENQPRPQDKTDGGKRKVGHYWPWTVPFFHTFGMTLEERYGTAVSTCTPARTAVAERIQRRHVCQHMVAERLQRIHQGLTHRDTYWQTGSQRASTVVTWRTWDPLRCCPVAVDYLGPWCMFVMCNMRDSLDSILGCVGVLLGRNLVRWRSYLRGTSCILSAPSPRRSDWSWWGSCRSSWRTWRTSSKTLDTTFSFCTSESYSESESLQRRAGSQWDQDGRCSARFRSHLQDEQRRSQSKLQGRRC